MRYSIVEKKNRREIVLLRSLPCSYGKCKFCNYIEDNGTNEDEINRFNFEILKNITGKIGVLEVINSGSVFELPKETLEMIRKVVVDKGIKVVYFEAYYGYHKRLGEIKDLFKGVEVRFRIGLETFDNDYRVDGYGKNFRLSLEEVEELGKKFYSTCLLVGTKGQTKEMLKRDIELGLKYFKQITINVFIENGTEVKQDKELVRWLMENYGHLKEDERVELLYDNKDLGVFEQ